MTMTDQKNDNYAFAEGWVISFAKAFKLAPRERQLLGLMMEGHTETAELALLMDVTPGTIKTMLNRIYAHTDTHSRVELVLAVVRHHFEHDQ